MICSKCGANLDDGATFCQNCGAKVETAQPVVPEPQPVQVQQPVSYNAPEKKHVSLGGWLLRLLINLIPCVGGLIFFIMLFVWSFDESYDDTSRNWAKAQLIYTGIIIVLIIAYLVINGAAISAAMDSIMNGTYNGGSYYFN